MVSISIITPALEHPNSRLHTQLEVLHGQMGPQDEHLIYSDGPFQQAEIWAAGWEDERIKYVETPSTRQNGNAQREQAMAAATGDVLYFLDDSMLPFPNTLETIRRTCPVNRPTFYRIYYATQPSVLKWTTHEWKLGTRNVNAAMLVTPNDPEKLGSWHLADGVDTQQSPYGYPSPKGYETSRAGGYFVDATVKHYPEGPVWRPEFISVWFE